MQDCKELAEQLMKEEKYAEALDQFLQIKEESPQLFANIGHCYFKQKRLRLALKYFKKIPKPLMDSEPFKQVKKEMNLIKNIYMDILLSH